MLNTPCSVHYVHTGFQPNTPGLLCDSKPLSPPDRAPRLFFTLGAQRSGKTTLARKWLHREEHFGFEDDNYPRFLWDSDLLRLELHGEAYRRESEPMVFAIKRYAIATALRAGHDVIVAGTHTSAASIRRILEIRRDAIPILVDTPLEICLQRARDTNQEYLLDVIPRVHAQVQKIKSLGVDHCIDDVLRDMDNKNAY